MLYTSVDRRLYEQDQADLDIPVEVELVHPLCCRNGQMRSYRLME